VECWFYLYANGDVGHRNNALRNVKAYVSVGARSPDWDLTANIERAEKDGHPETKWLPKLAAVINEKEPLSVLDDWPAWRDAAVETPPEKA
jgi:hypothetical protein